MPPHRDRDAAGPTQTKPSSQPKPANSESEIFGYISSALIASNAAKAFSACKSANIDKPEECWTTAVNLMRALLGDKYVQQLIRNAVTKLAAMELGAGCVLRSEADMKEAPQWFKDSFNSQQDLLKKVAELSGKLNDAHQQCLITELIANGVFLYHLKHDVPAEKRRIARHVVDLFFKDKRLSCFIQASTAAVHLAEALAIDRDARKGCLLYTNSIAVPAAYLSRGARHSVYTFCGPVYDDECGAWLYGTRDGEETEAELRKLFRRDDDRLTVSFLSPLVTSVQEGVFYRRTEAAEFASVLCDESRQIVVMAPSNRVLERIESYDKDKNRHPAATWDGLMDNNKEVWLVIGPTGADKHMADSAQALADKGISVHWYDQDEQKWKVAARKNT